MTQPVVACTKGDCTAPAGGPCAIGHSNAEDCPNAQFGDGAASTEQFQPEAVEDLPRPEERGGQPLALSAALTLEEANALIADAGARIALPLGPSRVGKTTLMVEIYERYVRGPWGGTSFIWSETLLEFERLAFAGRLNSGADIPDTWRTRLEDGGRSILHLELIDGLATRNLLFVNQSGELSDRVRNGRDPAIELPLLGSADRIPICVDGALVAESPGQCDRALSHAQQLIRVLGEKASFAARAQLALVVTKWDVIEAAPGAKDRWLDAESRLLEDLRNLGRGETAIRLAARPLVSTPEDDGMATLLRWLLEETAPLVANRIVTTPPLRAMGHFEATS